MMNAFDPDLGVGAANDFRTPLRPAGTMETVQDCRGSARAVATPRETAGGTAKSGNAPAVGADGWLCLAAAPAFAIMALLAGVLGGGRPDLLCSAARDASPLSGMVPMYLLMSTLHSAPWLKLIATRWCGGHRC